MKKIQKIAEDHNIEEDVVTAYREFIGDKYFDEEEDENLGEEIDEAYQGEWASDEEFVQDLVEGIGDLPRDLPFYIHIDWEGTARDIMMDYGEVDGHYFRQL